MSNETNTPAGPPGRARAEAASRETEARSGETPRAILFNWTVMTLGLGGILALAGLMTGGL